MLLFQDRNVKTGILTAFPLYHIIIILYSYIYYCIISICRLSCFEESQGQSCILKVLKCIYFS